MKSVSGPAGTGARDAAGQWPRAVLFDLDGSLVDTGPDIAAAVNRTLEDLGLASYPADRIFDWMGDGVARLVQRGAGLTKAPCDAMISSLDALNETLERV